MFPSLELPSYQDQTPEVAARFARIRQRPVVLELQSLGKQFQTPRGVHTALRSIDLQVRRREFICVIGASGCGKSTLIRIIAGLDSPSSGAVLLDGRPVTTPGPDRGMVFQGYTLFPWLTVKKNIMFGLQMKNIGSNKAESEARLWVDMVGLTPFLDAYPHQLSGGMKQRVAIARALANQPRVLLMDEPFGALDSQTRCQMQSYLQQIWMNVDVTILFITHDLDEAIYLADRVVVLGPHPGHVKEIIEVPLPQPRTSEMMVDPRFVATRKRLDDLIHPPTEQSTAKLPMLRMTQVGDEVI